MKFIYPLLWNAASKSSRAVSLFLEAMTFFDQRESSVSDDKVLCQRAVNDNILWDSKWCLERGRASYFSRQIGLRNKTLLAYISV